MSKSAIEWTDETDNIIVVAGGGWWCQKISPACAHCYAEDVNDSDFFGGNHLPYSGPAPQLILREEILDRWKRQTRPRKHFVASMTDVFGEWVRREWIFKFLDAMHAAPRQTFQVLTKRAGVMRRQVLAWLIARGLEAVPANIWLGVSVEDQQRANERIPQLIDIPAAVRFLSVEPLLGPVDLSFHLGLAAKHEDLRGALSWVIVGGESGAAARPMHRAWPETLRDQCVAADVAFFFKQWGEWYSADFVEDGGRLWFPNPQGNSWTSKDLFHERGIYDRLLDDRTGAVRVGKKKAGRFIDGRQWSEFPR
jgi:protein gp37